ncbi:hypothetical protein [Streptomyces sp. NPDC026589]|uniref:hypothetical protein n=1 Tax=Streptomyces sp. NPDC026589 TaxID=3155609 RepID=UPI0033DDBFEC
MPILVWSAGACPLAVRYEVAGRVAAVNAWPVNRFPSVSGRGPLKAWKPKRSVRQLPTGDQARVAGTGTNP